jgi:hyperosmotically inducible periplasmic protein
MPRKFWALVPAALGLALTVGTRGIAQEPKDLPPTPPPTQPKGAAETISNTVDSVVQSIKKGATATSETVQEQYHRARAAVHDMSVQARVYSRLHWDKDLATAKLEIELKDGTAILHGAVKSLHAKAKAIELARDTVGVDRVDEHLKIDPASATDESDPVGKAKP